MGIRCVYGGGRLWGRGTEVAMTVNLMEDSDHTLPCWGLERPPKLAERTCKFLAVGLSYPLPPWFLAVIVSILAGAADFPACGRQVPPVANGDIAQ